MYQAGYAQEIITPPTGVGLAGYFNQRPNQGTWDDLYVKVLVCRNGDQTFGFMAFDLLSLKKPFFQELREQVVSLCGQDLWDGLIVSATHTHTAPLYYPLEQADERTRYAFKQTVQAAVRALQRALRNLQPAQLDVGAVSNNPFGFVRRYIMKNGDVVTNPGWCNPNIDRPETNFDRTIGILAVRQHGRLAALLCNVANHGDTIGGNLVSADWMGRCAQAIQYHLKSSLPVIMVDDASGNINHFDLNQKICQTAYQEAVRIGRGYADIILQALKDLKPVTAEDITIANSTVKVPHRKLTDAEVAQARHILDTIPDIPREGDLESQDLARKDPQVLRYFARRALDCHLHSTPYDEARLTVIRLGSQVAFATLPGEPFNGIGAAIRAQSPCDYTFVIELSQSEGNYIPTEDCFQRGGYEVQPHVNSAAPEAATVLINGSLALFQDTNPMKKETNHADSESPRTYR